MLEEFITSLDILAAVITLLYIGHLLFQGTSSFFSDLAGVPMEKRSLLNQHVLQRH